ncbi:MAG: hypothetical protein EXR93_08125 [Gemmatimonadetes bacterium]|nr:hypothetical protein [Gemmatimonadota bacterium]
MRHLAHPTRSARARSWVLGFTLLFGGCQTETGLTTPETAVAPDSTGFSSISLSQAAAETAAPGAGLRIEVRIKPKSSPLVASELALDPASVAGDAEQVQANIQAVDRNGSGGTISTDIGTLKVAFDGNTAFTRDEGAVALTADAFAAFVAVELAAGRHPHFRARRAPLAAPQAPNDASFLATQVTVGGTSDALKIDLNVGKDHLALNQAPPPDAFLRLLGLQIEIRISDGTTRIGHRQDQPGQSVEFAGPVQWVDLQHNAFVVVGGLAVQIIDKTVIEGDDLKTLADVADAMKAGFVVESRGAGAVTSTTPRVINASKVRFEKHRLVTEFRELVKSVDVAGRKFTLSSGAVLCLDANSVIDTSGDQKTLAEVAAALAAGKAVGAAGAASPAPDGSGCRALALKVKFTQAPTPPPPPPPVTEFHDVVKSADAAGKKVTLNSNLVLCFDDHSVIDSEGDAKTLADVAAAIAAGKRVYAAGGVVPTTGAGCAALVLKVRFVVAVPPPPPPPPVTEVHEGVKAVNVTAKTVTLSNDILLCMNEQSLIVQEGDFRTLASVAAALADHKNLKADGTAMAAPAGGTCKGIIVRVKFSIR